MREKRQDCDGNTDDLGMSLLTWAATRGDCSHWYSDQGEGTLSEILELMKWFLVSGFKCRSCFLSHADPNILTWWVYVMNVCVRGVERWQDICQGQWWSRGDQWHMVRPGQQGWTPLVTYSGSVSLSWHHDHHCSPLSSLTCVLCPAVSCSNN